jgi:transcriptional regulator with XRE-family HTH domain
MKTLGQRIRQLREERDLSLRELGKASGVTAPFLSDIELGRRYPSEKVLSSIAATLGTTLKDLRSHDPRPTIEDMKQLAAKDPLYGVAFRRVIDKKIKPEDLLKLLEDKPLKKKS